MIFFKPEKEYKERFTKDYFVSKYHNMGKWQAKEIKGAVIILVMFALLLTQSLHGLGVYLCIMLPVILGFFPFMGFGGMEVLRKVNYTTVFFVCGTFCVGTVGNAVGAANLVAQFMTPLLGAGNLVNCGMAYIIGYVVKLILTPMAGVAMISGPIAKVIAVQGAYPVPVMYAMINGLNNALLPYEGAMYVFLYSFGYMSMKQFMKIFTVRSVIMLIWIVVAAVPYWTAIGLFDGFVAWPF